MGCGGPSRSPGRRSSAESSRSPRSFARRAGWSPPQTASRRTLLNRKHHDAEKRFAKFWIDPYSSAAWFDGWAQPVRGDELWKRELFRIERPTEKATVWLLTTGWKRHGLLKFDERPG